MVKTMRNVNIVFLALMVIGLGQIAFTKGIDIYTLIGSLIWVLPPWFAVSALNDLSDEKKVKRARSVNRVLLLFMAIILVGLIFASQSSDKPDPFNAMILPFVLFIILFVFNLKALKYTPEDDLPVINTDPEPASYFDPDATQPIKPQAAKPFPLDHGTSSNYLIKHWRGELTLPVSYWVNGFALNIVLVFMLGFVESYSTHLESLRVISLLYLLVLGFVVIISIWSAMGIWRSASFHESRGGSAGWATTAKFFVIVGTLSSINQLNNNLVPQMKEYGKIALGDDPISELKVTVTSNGKAIVLEGGIRTGSADKVKQILDAAPSVNTIVLDSHGGRLHEAERIAAMVRERKMKTYVENQCASACTYIFLASDERAATPNARIGFHKPSFSGMDEETVRSMANDMIAQYKKYGIDYSFTERVREITADDMWYPTHEELINANVITRTSLGGEHAVLFTSIKTKEDLYNILHMNSHWLLLEKRIPGATSRAVNLAWQVKEQGGSDAEILTASRAVFSDAIPVLLKTASSKIHDDFINLSLNQLKATLNVSEQACGQYLKGELNITKIFPKEMIDEEMLFYENAITSTPVKPTRVSDAVIDRIAVKVAQGMTESELDMVGNMQYYSKKPGSVCRSFIKYYENLLKLSQKDRYWFLSTIYQDS